MDAAEIERMMADLGQGRREQLSAPDVDARGRLLREDPRHGEAIRASLESRRTQGRASGSATDGDASRLQAWNAPDTFDRDPISDQLEDYYGGQGHRAQLQARRRGPYDRLAEETEHRVGEERHMYLQERAARGGGNYVATPPQRTGQDRFRDMMMASSAPRALPNGRQAERGRFASPPKNSKRASSPRAFGTVRFGPGGKGAGQTSAAPRPSQAAASPSTGTEPAANMRTLYAATRTKPTTGLTGSPLPPVADHAQGQSSMKPMAPSAPSRPVQAVPALNGPSSGSAAHTASASVAGHTIDEQARFETMAKHYAKNPGKEADLYRLKHPDREPYFLQAEKPYIKTVFSYVLGYDGRTMDQYLVKNKGREQMLAEALKAKEFVEHGSKDDMDRYYAKHPGLVNFCTAARLFCKKAPALQPATPGAAPSAEPAQPIAAATTAPLAASPQDAGRGGSGSPQSNAAGADERVPCTTASKTNPQRAQHVFPNSSTNNPGTSLSVNTAPIEPASSLLAGSGTVSVLVNSCKGALLSIHAAAIKTPWDLQISARPGAKDCDPQELITHLENFVRAMGAMSRGASVWQPWQPREDCRGLEGVKRGADDLYDVE